jgi:hypothetical protein
MKDFISKLIRVNKSISIISVFIIFSASLATITLVGCSQQNITTRTLMPSYQELSINQVKAAKSALAHSEQVENKPNQCSPDNQVLITGLQSLWHKSKQPIIKFSHLVAANGFNYKSEEKASFVCFVAFSWRHVFSNWHVGDFWITPRPYRLHWLPQN